ncbi:hypothetical protein ABZ608_16645 [Streptomyces sp. NPDC013172]|uniref:hypothetical protein n=1 Tax=Streptomyces sp. NPDC013172 TaxID=3155009 RepID=UPI0033F6117D
MNKNIDRPVVVAANVFGVRSTVQAAPWSAPRATGTAVTGTDPVRRAVAARIRGAEAIIGARAARAAKAAAAAAAAAAPQAPRHPHPAPTAAPASTPATAQRTAPAPAPAQPAVPAMAQPPAPAAFAPLAPEGEQTVGDVGPVVGHVATYAEDLAGPVLGGGDVQPAVAATGPLAFPAVPEYVHGPQQARTSSL